MNERNENVYDRKIGEAAVVATEKSIAEAIVGFMESNVGKPFSISDFREYLGAVTNDRLVTYAVSLEHDFPNLIGTVNEANRTAKEGVFTDILV